MVGRYVEIPYENKTVKAATMFVNKTVQAFKLAATERVSMLHFDLLINNLDCISSRMYRRSLPPFPFLSYLYGTLKPFI